ncbi:MAG: hypothetical protein QMD73_13465 [Rhodocyclaceae bacterium]|nr:hypothetical protein [Rhodocyclaceae bacterium]
MEHGAGGRSQARDSPALHQLSSHILPTSATMVGVCMTVLSIGRLSQAGRLGFFIDKLLAADAIIFLASAVLSFLSIRVVVRASRLEGWAEEFFLVGLILITLITVLIAFTIDL